MRIESNFTPQNLRDEGMREGARAVLREMIGVQVEGISDE
jgi:hypothetical protein